jgi:hypothetical protein
MSEPIEERKQVLHNLLMEKFKPLIVWPRYGERESRGDVDEEQR